MINANELLKNNGLHKTKIRLEILNALLDSKKPMSIFDFKKIDELKDTDESSIYRNINQFEKNGLIRAIPSSNDFQSYEFHKKGHHHHHMVCNECGNIECLPVCSIDRELQAMTKSTGFEVKGHSLEVFGLCQKCKVHG